MLTLERKQACKQCGAKNPLDAERCATCTRPLTLPINPMEQAFSDDLWHDPVSKRQVRKSPTAVLVIFVALLGLGVANYFVWGFGPQWSHRVEADPPGSSWRTYRDNPAYTIQLPGDPATGTRPTAVGRATFVTVGVNSHWDAVLDAGSLSPDAITDGRRDRVATLVVADSGPTSDAGAFAAASLGAAVSTLDETSLTMSDPTTVDGTTRTEITATAATYPDETTAETVTSGNVRAVVITTAERTIVVSAFFDRGVDPNLVPALVSHLELK